MGEMRILDGSGDTKQIWDPGKSAEVDAAEAMFDKLVGEKDYSAYKVGRTGKKSSKLTKFDPEIGKMILVPPIVGG